VVAPVMNALQDFDSREPGMGKSDTSFEVLKNTSIAFRPNSLSLMMKILLMWRSTFARDGH